MIDSCDCERLGPEMYTPRHIARALPLQLSWDVGVSTCISFVSIPVPMTALAVSQFIATSSRAGMRKGVAALVTVVLSLLGFGFGFSSPSYPDFSSSLRCSPICGSGWRPALPTSHGLYSLGCTAP